MSENIDNILNELRNQKEKTPPELTNNIIDFNKTEKVLKDIYGINNKTIDDVIEESENDESEKIGTETEVSEYYKNIENECLLYYPKSKCINIVFNTEKYTDEVNDVFLSNININLNKEQTKLEKNKKGISGSFIFNIDEENNLYLQFYSDYVFNTRYKSFGISINGNTKKIIKIVKKCSNILEEWGKLINENKYIKLRENTNYIYCGVFRNSNDDLYSTILHNNEKIENTDDIPYKGIGLFTVLFNSFYLKEDGIFRPNFTIINGEIIQVKEYKYKSKQIIIPLQKKLFNV